MLRTWHCPCRHCKLYLSKIRKPLIKGRNNNPMRVSGRCSMRARHVAACSMHAQALCPRMLFKAWVCKPLQKALPFCQAMLSTSMRRAVRLPALGLGLGLLQNRAAAGRPKPMPATATAMVKAVWSGYFFVGAEADQVLQANRLLAESRAGRGAGPNRLEVAKEVEEDENAEEDEDDTGKETALAGGSGGKKGAKAGGKRKAKGQASKVREAAACWGLCHRRLPA